MFVHRQPTFRSPLVVFGIVALGIGTFLFLGGLIGFAIARSVGDDAGRIAGTILLLTLSGQGAIWLVVGLIVRSKNIKAERLLEYLRAYGDHFQAEEVVIVPNHAVRVNNSPSVRAECIYTNQSGQRCRVRSRMFMWHLWGQESALGATVFVDRQDPSIYAVEMYYNPMNNSQVDIDYT